MIDKLTGGKLTDFNPRSREGSDLLPGRPALPPQISIHAPARGATLYESGNPLSFFISIHAPARGATRHTTATDGLDRDFNPRSREGSDAIAVFALWTNCDISIHAPARGATVSRRCFPSFKYHFNPRSREGSDSAVRTKIAELAVFQSTLPRGERQTCFCQFC